MELDHHLHLMLKTKTIMRNYITLTSLSPSIATEELSSSSSKMNIAYDKMSDREIIALLQHKSLPGNNRLRSHQSDAMINISLFILKSLLVGCLFMLLAMQTFGQQNNAKTEVKTEEKTSSTSSHEIKGLIKSDEDKATVPGVNVYLKGTTEGTYTNANGQFIFPKKLQEGDVLVFSSIGFLTQEFIIPGDVSTEIEIHMAPATIEMVDATADHEIYSPNETGLHKMWDKVKSIF
jgi:hypothetical protein